MNIEEGPQPKNGFCKLKEFFLNFYSYVKFLSKKNSNLSLSQKISETLSAYGDIGDNEQKNIILNVAHLVDDQVSDIMTPRTDIVSSDIKSSIKDVKKLMIKSKHMRIPVHNEALDDIKGFVHMKDVLEHFNSSDHTIDKLIRPILFVPPSMKVVDLLLKMRSKKINIAIVVDEYGGTDGVITLEDLFEQVFGNIQENEIEAINDNMYEVNARIKIEELEEKLDISLLKQSDQDDYDTLAGFLMGICKKIPKAGEVIEHQSGIKFHIKDADPRFIKTVVIEMYE
jgi:magnesium and cobalt transporter